MDGAGEGYRDAFCISLSCFFHALLPHEWLDKYDLKWNWKLNLHSLGLSLLCSFSFHATTLISREDVIQRCVLNFFNMIAMDSIELLWIPAERIWRWTYEKNEVVFNSHRWILLCRSYPVETVPSVMHEDGVYPKKGMLSYQHDFQTLLKYWMKPIRIFGARNYGHFTMVPSVFPPRLITEFTLLQHHGYAWWNLEAYL